MVTYSELVGRHGGIRAAARAVGMPYTTFHREYNKETQDPILKGIMDHEGTEIVPSNLWKRGITPDGHRFTAHFKPKKTVHEQEGFLDGIKAGLEGLPKSKNVKAPKHTNQDLCTYYPIVDQHHGLLTWGEETGHDWDSSLSAQRLNSAMDDLIQASPKSERSVILNLGDFTHANDQTNATPQSKHQLDVDGRHFKIMRGAVALLKSCIEKAKANHKHVIYRGLRGNHDEAAHIAITLALAEYYSNDRRVEVLSDPSDFFTDHFGLNMVIAHHGDKAKPERLVMSAADNYSEIWGQTKHRFCWTGHIHHKSAKDISGMLFESFRTLAPKDAYAHSHSYASRQSMTAITLHKLHGERVRNQVNYS